MRLLLLFLIAIIAGAGFYEYHENEQQVLDYTRERDQIFAHIAQLKKDKKALQDEQVVLKEKLAYLQQQSGALQSQITALPGPATHAPPAKPSSSGH